MRRRRFLTGVAAGSAAGLAGCGGFPGSSTGESDDGGPPRLGVEDRWLTDPSGHRVVLRGVNVPDPWWGTERADERGKDYWDTLRLAADADEGWHSRVLRVPVEPRSVAEAGVDAICSDYLDRAVSLAAELGVYLVIDYHAVERYDTSGVDERVRAFWNAVAPRYADEPHVLYELFNEPTEPASGGIDAWRTWREHAEPWVELVRGQAPDTPILVGGPRWSSTVQHAAEEPFADDNVVYTAHVYPSWERESWEPTFGDPALDVPVFVTEWGYVDAEDTGADSHMIGSTEEWGRPFREWLDTHANVNWCARAFDSTWAPSMFDDDWALLGGDAHMGELVKTWLADSREEHWPPSTADDPTATPVDRGRPPAAPADVTIDSVDETSAAVSWSAATDPDGDGILQYRVSVDGGEPAIRHGTVRAHEITGLEPGESYSVTVSAVDEFGLQSGPVGVSLRTAEPVEPVATIPRTTEAPSVDGERDARWAAAEAHSIDTKMWGSEDAAVEAEWYALWDDSALYYFVDVVDPDEWTDSDDAWKDDGVELYLDLDGSRDAEYDGENDLQWTVRRGETEIRIGPTSPPLPDGARAGVSETADGWCLELRVPWEPFGVTPITGHRFGMDVQVNDDTDGGDRDGKFAWNDESDEAWENPQAFGVVELGE